MLEYEICCEARQGSGSGLFRSQQFGTDQICYPCHILTRTVGQEAQSHQPTQISSAKIEIHQATLHVSIEGRLIDFYHFLSQT